jgi:hypothetical protein
MARYICRRHTTQHSKKNRLTILAAIQNAKTGGISFAVPQEMTVKEAETVEVRIYGPNAPEQQTRFQSDWFWHSLPPGIVLVSTSGTLAYLPGGWLPPVFHPIATRTPSTRLA